MDWMDKWIDGQMAGLRTQRPARPDRRDRRWVMDGKQNVKGGALCRYFGHFKTKSFKVGEFGEFKGIKRQAKIELSFDRSIRYCLDRLVELRATAGEPGEGVHGGEGHEDHVIYDGDHDEDHEEWINEQ